MILALTAMTVLLFTPTVTFRPVVFETLSLNYAPDSALTIHEGETQMFRAPLCKGEFINTWRMTAKVYMQNVPWDSAEIGDDNWLHIRVSNGPKMTTIVADNVKDSSAGSDPSPFTRSFAYNKDTWGSDDVYIEITASMGTPTFQYGLELTVDKPKVSQYVPDGMAGAVGSEGSKCKKCTVETLEQVAVPHSSTLPSAGDSGQYTIPFCFEDTYDKRFLAITTLVPEKTNESPGGVATYFCTTSMMKANLCFRSMSIDRGDDFFDASGAKVASVTPTVVKAEYGPVYLLVLSQGDWHQPVDFTISTKLQNPPGFRSTATGDEEHEEL